MQRSGVPVFLSWLVLAGPMLAQTVGAPAAGLQSTIIVTLNFNNAVLGTAEARRDLNVLQKKFAPREQQLQKLNNDPEASKKLLNDPTVKLTDSERSQRVQDLNANDKQFQREAEDFRNDSQSESQQIFQRVGQNVYAFLQNFAQQHGYAAVIERGTDAAPIIW